MSREVTKTASKTAIAPKNFPTNFKDFSKKELVKVIEDFMMPFSEPEKYKAMIRDAMPEFVREIDSKELAGDSIFQSSQEMMLAIAETLRKYHNFSDKDLHKFLKNLQGNLKVVEAIEDGGLSMLSDHSMRHIVDMVEEFGVSEILRKIAETRYQKERSWKAGLETPNSLQGSQIERKLQKPRI